MSVAICQAGSLGQVQIMRLMHPNIDVIHMAGYLRHHMPGGPPTVLDGYLLGYDALYQEILRLAPDVLFVHGDTPTATFIYRLVSAYKQARGAVGGVVCAAIFGEHASALPDEPFERSACDVLLLGDPEPGALALCEMFGRSGDPADPCFLSIPNIRLRTADGIVVASPRDRAAVMDLDALPPAARDLVDLKAYPGAFYKLSGQETSVLAARGCPWRCTYCGPAWHRALQTPRFRVRGAVSLADEIERLQREHGIHDFMLDITTFNFSKRWAASVCEEIIRRNLKVNLKAHIRADRADPELFGLMRRAGFWMVYLGIESANDRTLTGVKKQISVAQIEQALDHLHDAGIKVVAELMNLLFWEEDGKLVHEGFREARATLRFARAMFRRRRLHAMYWAAMTPVPASESYAVALRHGLVPLEVQGNWHLWFPIQRPIAELPGISRVQWYLIQWLGKAHQAYFILASRVLHRSSVGMIARRAGQLLRSTLAGLAIRVSPAPISRS